MVVNHLQTSHYHLGVICSYCIEYFITSTNTTCWHSQLCKPVLASVNDNNNDNDWDEESVNDYNGREYDDEFAFYKD